MGPTAVIQLSTWVPLRIGIYLMYKSWWGARVLEGTFLQIFPPSCPILASRKTCSHSPDFELNFGDFDLGFWKVSSNCLAGQELRWPQLLGEETWVATSSRFAKDRLGSARSAAHKPSKLLRSLSSALGESPQQQAFGLSTSYGPHTVSTRPGLEGSQNPKTHQGWKLCSCPY